MANEAHDPWALLREAREVVAAVAESGNRDDILRDRIDAALAEHDAVPPSEERWMQNGFVEEEQIADVADGIVIVHARAPEDWAWKLIRRGRCATEAEAKSAAIAAARGMR